MIKTLHKIFLIYVISFSSLMHGEYLKAQEGMEFLVLATRNPGEVGSSVFRLKDGDPLESGGGFRIKLKPQQKGKLQVKFNSDQGKTVTFRESLKIEKGEEVILPDKNKWYTLDINTGTETIVFEIENVNGTKARNKFRIQHINPVEISDGGTNYLVNNQKVAIKNKESKKDSERTLKSISLRRVSKLLDRINTDNFEMEEILSRGVGSWIYRQYSTAVVLIVTTDEITKETVGMGSGFIINNGDIITNWHVIKGYQSVNVYLKPSIKKKNLSEELLIGDIVNYNIEKDLALLKVRDYSYKYQSVELGKLKDIEIGEEVHLIGHPNGGMGWSYAKGSISSYEENFKWEDRSGNVFTQNILQTTAPINPGSSGGPLFNNYGDLIGVITWGMPTKQLINFAVSVDELRVFLNKPQKEYRTNKQRKPNILSYKDINNDGKKDVLFLDKDWNGVQDTIILDKNFDGKFESVILDGNENQIADGVGYDTDGDGFPELYVLDLNEDSKADLYGFDDNNDGEIDRYSKR